MPVPPLLRLSLREPASGGERLGYQLVGRGRALGEDGGREEEERGRDGGRPRLTFHKQVSLKSHDIFNQKAILQVIDANEPLSIANTTGKELKISPVFPWPVTSKMNF